MKHYPRFFPFFHSNITYTSAESFYRLFWLRHIRPKPSPRTV